MKRYLMTLQTLTRIFNIRTSIVFLVISGLISSSFAVKNCLGDTAGEPAAKRAAVAPELVIDFSDEKDAVGAKDLMNQYIQSNPDTKRLQLLGLAPYAQDILPMLTGFVSLQALDVSNQALTEKGIITIIIEHLSGLNSLNMSGNKLKEWPNPLPSRQLYHLQTLNVAGMKWLNQDVMLIARQCPNVTTLDVSGNQLTHLGAQYVGEFKRLTSLDISNNVITRTGVQHLTKVASLQRLKMKNDMLMGTEPPLERVFKELCQIGNNA